MEAKQEPLVRPRLISALIVNVSNGYILYENRTEYENRMNPNIEIEERKVFETKESLFEFLTHNI